MAEILSYSLLPVINWNYSDDHTDVVILVVIKKYHGVYVKTK